MERAEKRMSETWGCGSGYAVWMAGAQAWTIAVPALEGVPWG